MKKNCVLTFTAMAVAISNAALAEEQLDNLVITASGFEQETTEAPASISVITAEDIEKGAYRDLAEAIESVPGVQLARATQASGAGSTNIQMRGLAPDYTLFMIDGRPQTSRETRAKRADGYDQEWMPPLSMIERIEIIRGPMSTLYGSSAIGGVINIITKKTSNEWTGALRHEVVIAEGSEFNDSKKSSVSLSGPILKDVLSAQINIGYYDQEADEIEDGNPEKKINNLNAKFNLVANDNHTFGLDLTKIHQKRLFEEDDEEQENEKESIALTHSGKYGQITDSSYIQIDTTKNLKDDLNRTNEVKIQNTLLSSTWILPTEEHITSVGGSYNDAQLKDEDNLSSSGLTELSNNQLSLFAEDEWYMTDQFSLITGLRADKNENFKNHLSPKIYGVFSATETLTLKGGVSTGYKAPKLRQLSEDWAIRSDNATTYGNASLKPESSVNTEISAIFENDKLLASITVFNNHFEDKIENGNCSEAEIECPSGVGTRDRGWYNVDEAETKGLEISGKAYLTDAVSASLSYTYTDSEILTGDDKGSPLTSIPLHMATASVNWSVNDKLKVWTSCTYYGETNEEEDPTPSYKLVDLGANYTINKHLRVSLGMNNFLDEEFTDEEYGFVDHGREYWVALDASF
ncbi:TonB-dependent receptor [Marinomonas sp. THO17]|uniref:TonB-dependent receptor domain-containing protein n=1 Tax=Marinomonas sp. THO17 TaxID=3149048 RepID=UPI00336BC694